MSEQSDPIAKLLESDPRYSIEAYQFIRDSLAFAQQDLNLGEEDIVEVDELERLESLDGKPQDQVERHLTGQELCEAVRVYAIKEYGYLAPAVLKKWGLVSTGSIGDIVYNMIDADVMKKSDKDRREHFNDVYNFETAFENPFAYVEKFNEA